MKQYALITGASSGIGLEMAKIMASKNINLVLVARSSDKLEQLRAEIEKENNVSVLCLSKDLSKIESCLEIYEDLKSKSIEIKYLINNAGFGDFGLFSESEWKRNYEMIQLNMASLTYLCHLFLESMIKNKSGKILNVASTAAFQPGPKMAVYFASKAYVLHFSEALNFECQPNGVTVTALCPGPTASGFETAANMGNSQLFKNKKLPSSKAVALYAYESMLKGKAVAVHGFMNKILTNAVRFSPRSMSVAIASKIMS